MRLSPVLPVAALALSGVMASQALAGPITVTDVAVPYNETVTITAPGLDVTAYTGQIVLTTSVGVLDVWCIDLYHDIGVGNVGSLPYQFGTINTNFDGSNLTNTQISEVAGLIATGNSLMASSPSNVLSAGIQMAIWSVEFPSVSFSGVPADTVALDLPSLGFNGSPVNSTQIEARLVLDAPSLQGIGQTVESLTGQQSFATVAPDSGGSPAPVPEPMTAALLGSGFLALAGLRRARRA